MSIATFFIITKHWKQPKRPSTKEQVKYIVANLYNWIVLQSNKNDHISITYRDAGESQSHDAE